MKYTHPTTTLNGLTLLLLPLLSLTNANDAPSGGNCIKLSGNTNYTWKADGDFHGEGQIDNTEHCFSSGSGGISIGAPGAPKGASGNTRLECHFPSGETDADFYNCNLSLVDGFSAAVTCTVGGDKGWPNSKDPSAPIGCGYNLMENCQNWEDSCKCCKNPKGAHTSDISSLAPNFQLCKHSKENPNSAEVTFDMEGAYKFQKSDFPIECKIDEGISPKSKRVVDAHHSGMQKRHGHQHPRNLKARSLVDALST